MQIEKQAIDDTLVNSHDNFARHSMDIEMNTEFKVKLTPKGDWAICSQSLPMPIHLKEDLIVELALMHKHGIITIPPFAKYASPIFANAYPTANYVFLWMSGKSTVWLRMTILKKFTHLAPCRCSRTLGRKVPILQTRLLSGLSMFANGWPMINGNACNQSCQQSFCLQRNCTRSQQICVWIFKFHAWKLGPSCKSWPTCSVRVWHWNGSQKCYGPYMEHSSSPQVHSQSRIETNNREVQFRGQTIWIPRENEFTRKYLTTSLENPQFSGQT